MILYCVHWEVTLRENVKENMELLWDIRLTLIVCSIEITLKLPPGKLFD